MAQQRAASPGPRRHWARRNLFLVFKRSTVAPHLSVALSSGAEQWAPVPTMLQQVSLPFPIPLTLPHSLFLLGNRQTTQAVLELRILLV